MSDTPEIPVPDAQARPAEDGMDLARPPAPNPGRAPGGVVGPGVGALPSAYGSSRHRSRRRGGEGGSRSHSKTKKIVQLRVMVAVLLVLLTAVTVAAITFWSRVDVLGSEALSLSTDLSYAQKELDKARELMRQQENEISAMLARRIPGLSQIAFDTLFNANDKYLRKLTFSQSGVGADKGIEFHAVLENKGSGPLVPDVRIILFDRMGIQVGMVKIDRHHASNPQAAAELSAQETRTYTGPVVADSGVEPRYFLVQVK
jgi:hypothetical protein